VVALSLQCKVASLKQAKSTLFEATLVFFISFLLLTGGSRIPLELMCLF